MSTFLNVPDKYEFGGQDFLHGGDLRVHGNSKETLVTEQEHKHKDSCCKEMAHE